MPCSCVYAWVCVCVWVWVCVCVCLFVCSCLCGQARRSLSCRTMETKQFPISSDVSIVVTNSNVKHSLVYAWEPTGLPSIAEDMF